MVITLVSEAAVGIQKRSPCPNELCCWKPGLGEGAVS
jgi:hypothetical protein